MESRDFLFMPSGSVSVFLCLHTVYFMCIIMATFSGLMCVCLCAFVCVRACM